MELALSIKAAAQHQAQALTMASIVVCCRIAMGKCTQQFLNISHIL